MPKIRTEPVKRVYLTVPLTLYKRVAHAAGDMPVATYLVREALPKMLGDPVPKKLPQSMPLTSGVANTMFWRTAKALAVLAEGQSDDAVDRVRAAMKGA